MVRRPNRDAGDRHEVYDGTRHTGSVVVFVDGFRAFSFHRAKAIVTFPSEQDANWAVFQADQATTAVR